MKGKKQIFALGILLLVLVAPVLSTNTDAVTETYESTSDVSVYVVPQHAHAGEDITFITVWDNDLTKAYAIVHYNITQRGHSGSPDTGVIWYKWITEYTDYVDYSVQPVYNWGYPNNPSVWVWDGTDHNGNQVSGGDFFVVTVEVWEYTEDGTGTFVGTSSNIFFITE